MKNVSKSRLTGFTLIELLVVVLIIGILSAIALPQYQVAVAKSRFAQAMVLAKTLHDAQKRCYMASGAYCKDFDSMDVSLPAGGTAWYQAYSDTSGAWHYDAAEASEFSCTISFPFGTVACTVDRRGGTWMNVPTYRIEADGTVYCVGHSKEDDGNSIGNKVCKSLGGVKVSSAPDDESQSSYSTKYRLP